MRSWTLHKALPIHLVLLLCVPGLCRAADVQGSLGDGEVFGAFLKSCLVLAALWVLSRIALKRSGRAPRAAPLMSVKETLSLGSGKQLILAHVCGQDFLLTSSAAGVHSLGAILPNQSGRELRAAEPMSLEHSEIDSPEASQRRIFAGSSAYVA